MRETLNRAGATFATRRPPPEDATWARRTKPLLQACSSGDPCWAIDSASPVCMCCSEAFSFTNRRHHCRLCGALACGWCSSKSFDLVVLPKGSPRTADPAAGTVQPLRVCDGCFNRCCSAVHEARENSAARQSVINPPGGVGRGGGNMDDDNESKSRPMSPDEERARLMGGGGDGGEGGGGGGGKGSAAGAQGAAEQARDALVQRGEKLDELGEKTRQVRRERNRGGGGGGHRGVHHCSTLMYLVS
jgi:hypothetical protein